MHVWTFLPKGKMTQQPSGTFTPLLTYNLPERTGLTFAAIGAKGSTVALPATTVQVVAPATMKAA